MGTLITTPSTATEYQARFTRSMAPCERTRHLIPSAINHHVRRIVPFALYMDAPRAAGSGTRKGTPTMRLAGLARRSAG